MANKIVEVCLSGGKCNSYITTPMPRKSINEHDCNTTSSVFTKSLSKHNQSSEMSISLNHTLTDISVIQLPSTTHNLSINYNVDKFKKITNTNNSSVIFTPSPTKSKKTSKKYYNYSDLRIRIYHISAYTKNEAYHVSNSKNSNSFRSKLLDLEGLKKVDFMYYLAQRYKFVPVTEKIFSFLCGKDIIAMSNVSKVWHNAVEYSPSAKKKRRYYLKYMESEKENKECVRKIRSAFSNRRILADISNDVCLSFNTNGNQRKYR